MSTFKTLSDLVADAEDLLSRLDNSTSPEIRALKERVNYSILDMRRRFKRSMKAARRPVRDFTGTVRSASLDNPWVPATAGVVLALGLLYMVLATSDDR